MSVLRKAKPVVQYITSLIEVTFIIKIVYNYVREKSTSSGKNIII